MPTNMLLLLFSFLILVAYHARLVEVTSRLDFLWKRDAERELAEMKETRKNNRQLLRNILPDHVAHHFLSQDRHSDELYSQSRNYVAVMFASIPNFTEFYSEDVNKGVECIRLLNEIIVDFDELLSEPRFSPIEKIKTVGASYMAASGLNPTKTLVEGEEYSHVSALVDFALAMKSCLEDVNKHSFNNFQLRVGISCGPLVAGVIGARKPVFDIWGNTVNEASRMDSTGFMGRIQVACDTAKILSACGYELEYRGIIQVKGKGPMETFFVIGKENSDSGFVRQSSQQNSLAALVFGMVQWRKRQTVRRPKNVDQPQQQNRLNRAKSHHARSDRQHNPNKYENGGRIVNFNSFRLSNRNLGYSLRINSKNRRPRSSECTPQTRSHSNIDQLSVESPVSNNDGGLFATRSTPHSPLAVDKLESNAISEYNIDSQKEVKFAQDEIITDSQLNENSSICNSHSKNENLSRSKTNRCHSLSENPDE